MAKDFVVKFKNGRWLGLAKNYLASPDKMQKLMAKLNKYTTKEGLASVQDELSLLVDFVKDITRGNYSDYDGRSIVLAVAALIYVVSPLDLIPDFIAGLGLIDDGAILLWATTNLSAELEKYKAWKQNGK